MKTTLDLPMELVREIKIRAAHEGRKIKDVATTLITAGMSVESVRTSVPRPRKGSLKFPLFGCAKNAAARRMSIGEILALEQGTQTQDDIERLSLSL